MPALCQVERESPQGPSTAGPPMPDLDPDSMTIVDRP
jgi:hypothetical protein